VVPLGNPIDEYLTYVDRTLATTTAKMYRSNLTTFRLWLIDHKRKEAEVCYDDIASYLEENKDRWKPRTYNFFIAVFKSYAKWRRNTMPVGKDAKEMRKNAEESHRLGQIIETVKRRKPGRSIDEDVLDVSVSDLKKFLHEVKEFNYDDFCVLWLLAYTGVRKGELAKLPLDRVDFNKKLLIVKTEKRGEEDERLLYFDDFTAGILKSVTSGKVKLPTKDGQFNTMTLKYDSLWPSVHVYPHFFRNLFSTFIEKAVGTVLAGDGAMKQTVMKKTLMGHTKSVSENYVIVEPSEIRAVMVDHHFLRGFEKS